MAKLAVLKGTTSFSVDIFIQDSSVTTGAGLSGLTNTSTGIQAWYRRGATGTPTQIGSTSSLTSLANAQAAWSSGGFVAVSSMTGLYRFDIPDAVLASGVNDCRVMLFGATNMVPVVLELQLVSYDPNDAVRLGLTAMPNAASGSAGAIITSGTGTAQLAVTGGRANSDVVYWNASAVATPNVAGYPRTDVAYNAGSAITSASGRQEVNVSHFGGTAGTFSAGIPSVNTAQWRGTQPNVLISGRVDSNPGATQAGVITSSTFATDAIDANALAASAGTEIATAVGALVVETAGSITLKQFASLAGAVLYGQTTSSGNTIKTADGTATRVTATVSSNTRTAMTLNPSA